MLAALAATASVFALARPEYHPPSQGLEVKLDLSKYPPRTHGWTWEDGQPGFGFGEDDQAWNISQVKPVELAPVRAAARRWGVAPRSVRILSAIRLAPGDLSMIVAGTNAADRTCLGFVTPSEAPSFYCPNRLGAQSAFVLVTTRSSYENGGQTVRPTFLTGIARGEVTRVVVDQRPDWPNTRIYDRTQGSLWGTFELSLGDSRETTVAVYGMTEQIAKVPLNVTVPGYRLLQISG